MLRNRSRTVTRKQALMADHTTQSSYNHNYRVPISSFFASPWFAAFTAKILSEIDSAFNPISMLYNPLWYNENKPKLPETFSGNKHYSWEKLESKGIGLALEENSCKPINRKVLFSSEIKIASSDVASDTPKSPSDFGTKTRNSQFLEFGSANSGLQTSLSMSEMENSEDYTCVIAHGPNPRTTHIFDNCIVESCLALADRSDCVSENVLSICFTCKKNVEQKNQIYIYRCEKAFCSAECCYQDLLVDSSESYSSFGSIKS